MLETKTHSCQQRQSQLNALTTFR